MKKNNKKFKEFKIRLAKLSDSQDIWKCRNDKKTREMSENTKLVSWEAHQEWFKEKLSNSKSIIYIGETFDSHIIGMVRLDIAMKFSEISINLNPKYRGLNLSHNLLLEVINKFSEKNNIQLKAKVKSINTASKKCFIKSGFHLKKEEFGYQYYEYKKLPKLSFKFIANACGIFTGKNI